MRFTDYMTVYKMPGRTKNVATIGPATDSPPVLEALVRAAEGKSFIETPLGQVYLKKVEVSKREGKDTLSGQVKLILPKLALIKAKDGFVKIDRILWKGFKMSFFDFCTKNRIKSGDRL